MDSKLPTLPKLAQISDSVSKRPGFNKESQLQNLIIMTLDTALFSKGLTPKPLSIWTLVCSRALHRAQYTVESSAISALSPFVS